MTRPSTLLYGTDECPPAALLVMASLQFVAIVLTNLTTPIALLRLEGVPSEQQVSYLQVALLVVAGGTLLQWLRRPFGGGVFAPPGQPWAYLPGCLAALQQGGVPLMAGMTAFAALVHVALSWMLPRLRPYFPPEVSGVIVVMIGFQTAMVGAAFVLDDPAAPLSATTGAIGGIVMVVMFGLTVWGRGAARLLAGLLALVAGFTIAVPAGLIHPGDWALLLSLPLVSTPAPDGLGFAFDPALILAFVLPAVAATMTTAGNLTTQQQLNDAGWVRPDLSAIACGVRADGFAVLLAGLLGNYPATTSISCTALMSASGITSRCLAPMTAGLVAFCAFVPILTGLIAVMPGVVIGSVLVFSACFIFISGTQIIATRLLDARRTLVVGAAVMINLVVQTHPTALVSPNFSASMNALLSSAFTVGAASALLLNLLFRVGVHQRVRLLLRPGAIDHDAMEAFIRRWGAAWGARRDVMARVTYAAIQSAETISEVADARQDLLFAMAFDEFRLHADFTYEGPAIELSAQRPSLDEIRATDDGHLRLAGFLLRGNADRVTVTAAGGRQRLRFEFDH